MNELVVAELAGALTGALMLGAKARTRARAESVWRLAGRDLQDVPPSADPSSTARTPQGRGILRALPARWRAPVAAAGLGAAGAYIGLHLVPVFGPFIGAAAGAAVPLARERRKRRKRAEILERQLADLVESTALAIRGGYSIAQAIEFAQSEVEAPLSDVLGASLAERRLGLTLEDSLGVFASAVDTDDARLFVLVIGIQAKSGGNLAGALDEVTATIRHRLAIRRELRALSAQGRLSAVILGCLPIGFFLVLAVTSREQLEPVFRSPSGITMISAGLVMQALAYLWIRRLLRIEA